MKGRLIKRQRPHTAPARAACWSFSSAAFHGERFFITLFLSAKRLRLNEKPLRLSALPSVSTLQGKGSLSAASAAGRCAPRSGFGAFNLNLGDLAFSQQRMPAAVMCAHQATYPRSRHACDQF